MERYTTSLVIKTLGVPIFSPLFYTISISWHTQLHCAIQVSCLPYKLKWRNPVLIALDFSCIDYYWQRALDWYMFHACETMWVSELSQKLLMLVWMFLLLRCFIGCTNVPFSNNCTSLITTWNLELHKSWVFFLDVTGRVLPPAT